MAGSLVISGGLEARGQMPAEPLVQPLDRHPRSKSIIAWAGFRARSVAVASRGTFSGSSPNGLLPRPNSPYRCGGSAGISPASQLSTAPKRRGGTTSKGIKSPLRRGGHSECDAKVAFHDRRPRLRGGVSACSAVDILFGRPFKTGLSGTAFTVSGGPRSQLARRFDHVDEGGAYLVPFAGLEAAIRIDPDLIRR